MKQTSKLSKRVTMRALLVTGAVGLAVLTAVVSGGVSGAGGERRASAVPSVATAAKSATQTRQPEFKSTVRVFIHPDDIYPLVARVRPGKVIISAENNTQKDVAVVVEPALTPGQPIGLVASPVRDKRNQQEFTLGAGEYVFYEESRPKRQGKLIVDTKLR